MIRMQNSLSKAPAFAAAAASQDNALSPDAMYGVGATVFYVAHVLFEGVAR